MENEWGEIAKISPEEVKSRVSRSLKPYLFQKITPNLMQRIAKDLVEQFRPGDLITESDINSRIKLADADHGQIHCRGWVNSRILEGRTAGEIRKMGGKVDQNVPDRAVLRNSSFTWTDRKPLTNK